MLLFYSGWFCYDKYPPMNSVMELFFICWPPKQTASNTFRMEPRFSVHRQFIWYKIYKQPDFSPSRQGFDMASVWAWLRAHSGLPLRPCFFPSLDYTHVYIATLTSNKYSQVDIYTEFQSAFIHTHAFIHRAQAHGVSTSQLIPIVLMTNENNLAKETDSHLMSEFYRAGVQIEII